MNDLAGVSVSSAGDVNNDGFDDLIIGASSAGAIPGAPSSDGAAYVVFGSDNAFDTIDLADVAAGTGGFKIVGENNLGRAGGSVSSAGDVNNDGFDDLIVGASRSDGSGAAYIIYGDDWVV
ncbi:MAG: integrin alpha [Rhizobiaceae bacterium]